MSVMDGQPPGVIPARSSSSKLTIEARLREAAHAEPFDDEQAAAVCIRRHGHPGRRAVDGREVELVEPGAAEHHARDERRGNLDDTLHSGIRIKTDDLRST